MASSEKRRLCSASDECLLSGSKNKLSTKDVEEKKLGHFIDWCERKNLEISKKVIVSKEGSCAQYGMVAVEDIEVGETLFRVPRSLLLMPETSNIAQLLEAERSHLESNSGWVPILLCLMHEYNNPVSKWRPYLDLVPDFDELDLPLFWMKSEREHLLKGTSVIESVETDLPLMEKEFHEIVLPFVAKYNEVFLSAQVSLDLYKKMVAFTMAYSFTESVNPASDFDDDDDERAPPMMVPMADILNHKCNNNAELFYNVDALTMMSTKPIRKGEEVFNTYGHISNAQLMHMYGFAEPYPSNLYDTVEIPQNIVYEIYKELAEQEDLLDRKWKFLLDNGIVEENGTFLLGVNEFLTEVPLSYTLKVLQMNSLEFDKLKAKCESTDSDDDLENELENLNVHKTLAEQQDTLRRSAEKCLKFYNSSLVEDEEKIVNAVVNTKPARIRYSFYVCYGQKKLLEKLIKSCIN